MSIRYFKTFLVFAAVILAAWLVRGYYQTSAQDSRLAVVQADENGQIKNSSVESKGLVDNWAEFQKLVSLDQDNMPHQFVYIAANTDLDPALAKEIVNAPGLQGVYKMIDNKISGPIHFYNCSLSGLSASTAPCVFYKPRVQVQDNWEWCSGIDNPHTAEVETGYWQNQCGIPEINLAIPYAWVYFGGWIIVTAY